MVPVPVETDSDLDELPEGMGKGGIGSDTVVGLGGVPDVVAMEPVLRGSEVVVVPSPGIRKVLVDSPGVLVTVVEWFELT